MPLHSSMRRLTGTAALLVCLVGCASHAASHAAPEATSEPPLGFRQQPSFLPTQATPVDRVVTATSAHPQLAVQGVAVDVQLPAGHVRATITGPHVPPFVTPPPPTVTAVFDVTMAQPAGNVPIRLTDFDITDQLGRTFHPSLVQHEAALPGTLTAGRTSTFKVTAVMPTGEGRILWAPAGGKPIVGWDFIVEND